MGGGRRKFPQRQKYVPEEKKLGKFEEKEEKKSEEDVKSLLELWKKAKEKK